MDVDAAAKKTDKSVRMRVSFMILPLEISNAVDEYKDPKARSVMLVPAS
jgi:hypothetical protein